MIYRFDDCELDTDLYTFHKGGVSSALEPKVFDMLLFLIEHRGHIVIKHELLTHLWPNQYISEATLNHAIMAAREAIGDDGRQQRMIRTVRGRGYLFVPEIEVVNQPLPDRLPAVGDVAPVPSGEQSEAAGVGWHERPVTGERKSVTVLSCALDYVGALMEEVGLDAVHQHLQRFLALAEIAVNRYGGTITHFFDDGFRALFGAPVTYEDHARRGVLAALMLHQHVAVGETVEGRASVPDLGLRMGLHTGLVLMGSVGKPSQMTWTAIRGTTDLAICCQEHATPGTILVTEAVRRRIQEVVRLEPWEPVARPKSGEPLDVYRVVARRLRRVPLGQVKETNLVPFMGRDLELATLHALLRQAEEGRVQVVGIVGEPGIGKSRLLREFCRQLDKERVIYLEGHCLSYGSHTPYFVVVEMLRQEWGIVEGEPPEAIIANVRAGLRQADIDLDERAMCLLHLLGVPDTQGLLRQWTPEMIKAQTFSILQQLCFQPNRHLPLLLAVEDLHWVDTTSEALFASLVEQLAGHSVLLLATYRPGYHPVWMDKSYATQLALSRLTSDDSRCLVSSILDSMNHPDLGTDTIVAKADGNPFFLEELTQAFVEQAPTAAPMAVADTIQTVLAARIDRLAPTEKQLLQTAAVVGRDVPFDLLRALVDVPEDALRQSLMTLQTAEFLHVRRGASAQVYSFKHILTQEVAYASLLASTRRVLHRQIAHILERDLPQTEVAQPELLAYHYTAAELYEAAVLAWHQAGQRAMERSAYVDAIAHFTHGLEALAALPETPTRIQHELALHMALGSALTPEGYASARLGQVFTRARVLSQHLGDVPQRAQAIIGLWGFFAVRGELKTGLEIVRESLGLGQRLQDGSIVIESHLWLAATLSALGQLWAALDHINQALDIYDASQHRSHAVVYGQDPQVACLAQATWVLWSLGYTDQALARSGEALDRARALAHPLTLTYSLLYIALLHVFCREVSRVQVYAEELLALCDQYRFGYRLAQARILLGWAVAMQGETEVAVHEMQAGLVAVRATGAEVFRPSFLALLADVYCRMGFVDEGLRVIDEALSVRAKTGERFYEAELHRLKGELLLRCPIPDEAQARAHFDQALATARQQEARVLELRAAVSLCRFLHSQGDKEPIYDLLYPLTNNFTEGLDSPDLREARALLEM